MVRRSVLLPRLGELVGPEPGLRIASLHVLVGEPLGPQQGALVAGEVVKRGARVDEVIAGV